MKLKWLWIVLLVMMLVVVCGLIVSVLGIGLYSFSTVSPESKISGSVVDQIFNQPYFSNPTVSIETTEEKIFIVGNEEIALVVDNQFGDVLVQGKDTDQIYFSVLKTAWGSSDEEALQNMELLKYEVIEEPGKLTIRVLNPEKNINRPGSIDFKLDVPIKTTVEVTTKNGDLYAGNLEGKVDLDTSFGNLEIKDVQGGDVNAENKNGSIKLRGINAADHIITVISEFGDVSIIQANAVSLNAKTVNGRMEVENLSVSGDVDLSNNFGNVTFRNGKAQNLQVISVNGTITLNGVTVDAKLTAHTDFGSIDLDDTLAVDYDLLTKNGRIDLNGADQATLKVVTDFGDIELINIRESIIDAETRNGAIIVSASLVQGNHRLISDFGNITLRMPANQSVDCDIKTSFGKINSEFDMTVSGSIDEKHFVGKINGGGGGLLTIETRNGNINVEKTSVAEEE
jgi:DUF4097 and DUF4098 domain-containing protein YvlB